MTGAQGFCLGPLDQIYASDDHTSHRYPGINLMVPKSVHIQAGTIVSSRPVVICTKTNLLSCLLYYGASFGTYIYHWCDNCIVEGYKVANVLCSLGNLPPKKCHQKNRMSKCCRTDHVRPPAFLAPRARESNLSFRLYIILKYQRNK